LQRLLKKMQKLWQKKIKLNYKNIVDIVQYGSSVIEGKEPKDIDIAVIFEKIPLKEQLEEAQKIKEDLQKHTEIKIHIKSFDLYSLFDKGNFAKEGILFYGKSLIYKDEFSKRFGLLPKIKIFYSLKDLEKKGKVKFNYLLNGKSKKYGLIKKYAGKIISPGIVETKPEYEIVFTESMKKISKEISVKKIFEMIE